MQIRICKLSTMWIWQWRWQRWQWYDDESNLVKPIFDVTSDDVSVSSDKASLRVSESFDEECDNSSSEYDIPLFYLQTRLRGRVKNDITSDVLSILNE